MDIEIKSQPFTKKDLLWLQDGLRSGRIRRFGAIADHQKLNFSHNALIAWKTQSLNKETAGKLRKKDYISHIYLRQANRLWPYNLYTMVHARSQDELELYFREICQLLKYPEFKVLITIKEFKKTSFTPYVA